MVRLSKDSSVNTPNESEEKLRTMIDPLPCDQRDVLLEMLQQDQKERNRPSFESLFWNEKAILENIKENCLTVTWDVTYNAYGFLDRIEPIRWRVVKLDLPEVPGSDFGWFKIDLFISKDVSYTSSIVVNDKTREELCPREKLEDILKAINGYMRAYWVAIDENVDFNWDLENVPCKTWEYVEDLLGVKTGLVKGEKTEYGSKIFNFTLFPDRNGWEHVHYEEPYYYDDPESDSIPPSNPLIVLLPN